MKKFYSLISILAIPVSLLLFSYHTGSPGGKTGSPLDGANCTECHGTEPEEEDGWITSNIPFEGYTMGETYLITVTGTQEGVGLMGFELTAETSIGKSGEFTLIDTIRTQFTNSEKAVTHTDQGIEPDGDSNTWTVEWTAPSEGTPTVTFYAAVNCANGNGSNDEGDVIHLTNLEVQEISTGIGTDLAEASVKVYPNPASEYVTIEGAENATIQLISFLGQQVMETEASRTAARLNVSTLDPGIYFVRINGQGNSLTKKIVVN
jgi:hypothetical protein